MAALGFGWRQQIVASAESGQRRLTIGEVFGLAFVLETSIGVLLEPPPDDKRIALPSGRTIDAASAAWSVRSFNDGTITWDGDVPEFSEIPESRRKKDVMDAAVGPIARYGRYQPRLEDVHSPEIVGPEHFSSAPPTAEDLDNWQGWKGTSDRLNQPVVAAIVTSGQGVLIGRRNDRTPPWTFIAGEVEPGERPEDAAVREVKEETGLEVRAGQIVGERDHPATGRHMIYMAAEPTRGTEVFVGDEAELAEVRWVSLAEADELLPGMFGPVREYLAATIGTGSGS